MIVVEIHIHRIVSPRDGGVHDKETDGPIEAGENRRWMVPEVESPRPTHNRGRDRVHPRPEVGERTEGESPRPEVEVLEIHVRVRGHRVLRFRWAATRAEELHRHPCGIAEYGAGDRDLVEETLAELECRLRAVDG